MNSPRLDRRRAERFAELVDSDDASHDQVKADSAEAGQTRAAGHDDGLVELAKLTQALSELKIAPDPDPEFRSSLRSFLVATAEREGIGTSAGRGALDANTQQVRQVNQASPTTGRTRLALLAGAMVGAIVLSGVSVASTGSLPGDALYAVKISTEQAKIAMAGSDFTRGQLRLGFARSRLAEAGQVDRSRLATTLEEMDSETVLGVQLLTGAAAAGDTSALTTIAGFVDVQRDALLALSTTLPAEAQAAISPSLALLDRVEARVADLAEVLTRGCAQPKTDDLGIDPASC